MRNIYLIIIICSVAITKLHSQEFKINNHHIKGKVISASYFDNKIYCLGSDDKIFFIDSLYNIKYISNTPTSATSIFSINDSLFVKNKNDSMFYYKDNEFSVTKRNLDLPFFENDKYIVSKSCSGEWGGSIYFTDKSDGKTYECAATCPIIVNKLNNSYLVTASLAHMVGFAQVLEIDNPKDLTLSKKREKEKYVGLNESKTTTGAKILVDSIGVMIATSFTYNDSLFHIVVGSGNQGTSLCKIENNKFKEILKISEDGFWSYDPINVRSKDGKTLSLFQNYNTNGILFINGNKIDLYYFDDKEE